MGGNHAGRSIAPDDERCAATVNPWPRRNDGWEGPEQCRRRASKQKDDGCCWQHGPDDIWFPDEEEAA